MAKVSVIVPIFNMENYIEKCLKSLINQTLKDIEIWAISDGSTDASMKIVEKYSKKDSRIKPIEKENGGYGSVLEYAIKNIKSKYFIICDPDDWLVEEAIDTLYNIAEKEKVDFVVGDYNLAFNDGSISYESFQNSLYSIMPEVKTTNIKNFVFGKVNPHAKLYKTKIAQNIIFPYHTSYTDTILFYLYISRIHTAYYVNKPLAFYYYDRPNNTVSDMKKFSKKTFDQIIKVYKQTINQIDKASPIFTSLLCANYYSYKNLGKRIKEISKKEEREMCIDILTEQLISLNKYRKKIIVEIKSNNLLKEKLKKIQFYILTSKSFSKYFVKIL